MVLENEPQILEKLMLSKESKQNPMLANKQDIQDMVDKGFSPLAAGHLNATRNLCAVFAKTLEQSANLEEAKAAFQVFMLDRENLEKTVKSYMPSNAAFEREANKRWAQLGL
jgi:hypothetical protein